MTDVAAADDCAHAARDRAIRLLARREHSQSELRRKLAAQGYAQAVVQEALASLAAGGLQSDRRFVEGYVRSALNRGHGERKIRAALAERGIDAHLAADFLNVGDEAWQQLATAALRKRFGETPAQGRAERSKRLRFLLGRGFASATAARVVGVDGEEEAPAA